MLKVVMGSLNPIQLTSLDPPSPKQPSTSSGLFRGVASIQEAIEGLFKVELSLFCRFHLENVDSLNPLMWWATNESRFPNVSFFT